MHIWFRAAFKYRNFIGKIGKKNRNSKQSIRYICYRHHHLLRLIRFPSIYIANLCYANKVLGKNRTEKSLLEMMMAMTAI